MQSLKESAQGYSDNKKPKSVEFRESLPKTGSGKIEKSEIGEEYWKGHERRIH